MSWETKFEEFNLLIKEHDDISGIDNIPDTIKRAILVAREPEPLGTHLQLNSQSYSTFLEMRLAVNQYPERGERVSNSWSEMTRWTLISFTKSQTGKGKGNDKGKGKSKSKCSGAPVSCKSAHESQVFTHAEADCVIPNSSVASNVAGSRPTQQSHS